MSAYKSDIIRQNTQMHKDVLRMLQSSYNPNRDFWKERSYKTINKIYISKNERLDLRDDYYFIIQNLDELFKPTDGNNLSRFFYEVYNGDALSNLIEIRADLAYALQSIDENDSVYVSSNLTHLQGKQIKNNGDGIYALVQTSLPNEANILPMPTTLQDVWDMRKHPAILTFRNIMSEWDHYIQAGDINAADKIKKDIIKANKGLERLGKYKRLSSCPYVRTGLFLVGLIPALSNVLSIYSYAEPYIIDYIERKYSWTHINDCKASIQI